MKYTFAIHYTIIMLFSAGFPCNCYAGQGSSDNNYLYDKDCTDKGKGWEISSAGNGHIRCRHDQELAGQNTISGISLGDNLSSALDKLKIDGYSPSVRYVVSSREFLYHGKSISISFLDYNGIDEDLSWHDGYDYQQDTKNYPIIGSQLAFTKHDKDWSYTINIATSPVPAIYSNSFYNHSKIIYEWIRIESRGLFDESKKKILYDMIKRKFDFGKYEFIATGAEVTVVKFGYGSSVAHDVYEEAARQKPDSVEKPKF